ncbi:RHS repeat-associated core domain-containing protein [Snodgrassella alvi]|uniref:RHS repeat-associated core domain-containing protein n=1 Tax=Snodgrassella alvi TaxID=1196083 RepID=UPI001C559482|nr:RHS repeat-associated core domain-containing protein [Snodgrassella alvi]
MIQETGPNHPTSLYIYTDQNSYEPLARIDTDGNHEQHIRYFHTDLNGCPEELTDANGKILWECSFQLWGKRIHEIEHEPIEQNLRYQGQYLDRETGLHYNTFRYYDPDIGRFTQPDPIGLLGGFNLYQYAPNGLTWVDPWGWCPKLNRRQALNKAKDLANIPHSQQIERQWIVGNNQIRRGQRNYKYSEDLGSHGRYYEYKNAQGHKRVIVEHTNDPRAKSVHTHAGQPKRGANSMTYDFKEERYLKIIDPLTNDHHIYYE